MKVLVTSQGESLNSPVDPRFGRAKTFIVMDLDTGEYQAVSNTPNVNATQGAGIQSGRLALDLNVDAVVTGHVGPKAFATLLAAKIDIYTGAEGTVEETLQAYRDGRLKKASSPDVEGHW
ncbi:NifB/NifX family molybdenum-iron cluster-binding protein [bacterium]|nr:NifB/NifX family molybdenum-iron cluster-binding protein [candidate division CSSED10-310 bacterium]